jgi:hypothetical protein
MRMLQRVGLAAIGVLVALPLASPPASSATTAVHTSFAAIAPTATSNCVACGPSITSWQFDTTVTLGPTPLLASLDIFISEGSYLFSGFTLTSGGSSLIGWADSGAPMNEVGAFSLIGKITSGTGSYSGLTGASLTINVAVSLLGVLGAGPGLVVGTITVS